MADSDLLKIIRSLHSFGRPASIAEITNDIGDTLSSKGKAYNSVKNIIAKHMKDYWGNLSSNTLKSGGPAYFLAQKEQHSYQLWLLNKELIEENGIDLSYNELPENSVSSRTQNISHLDVLLDQAGKARGGGESEDHRALKNFVYNHPALVGLSAQNISADMEYVLPSADRIDLLFQHDGNLTAVEVKSKSSSDSDITRGLFQCIKYKALLEAEIAVKKRSSFVEAVLVIGKKLPGTLNILQEILNIKVIDDIRID